MHPLIKSHLALFVVNLMYGANYVVAKGLMPTVIGPNGFIFLRVAGAAVLFWLLFSTKFETVSKKDLLRLACCALFGVAINQLFFFNGLMRTSPVNASIIMTITPILVFILSLFILKEKPTSLKISGLIIGAVGSTLFTLLGANVGDSSLFGDLLIFANAASYALYLVLVKPLMAKYKPLTVITWVFTFGLIYVSLWPYSTAEFAAVDAAALTTNALLRFVFVVVGVTFLPYLLMVYAMKRVSPAISSTYIYLQPLLAAGFIYLFWLLGLENYTQDFSIGKILAALLIFVGVYLVIRPTKVKAK